MVLRILFYGFLLFILAVVLLFLVSLAGQIS